jgi:hypothetical protein
MTTEWEEPEEEVVSDREYRARKFDKDAEWMEMIALPGTSLYELGSYYREQAQRLRSR